MAVAHLALDRGSPGHSHAAPELVDQGDESEVAGETGDPESDSLGERHAAGSQHAAGAHRAQDDRK
jgi:hypothetical protein